MRMRVYAESRGFILLGIDNPGVVARQWRGACRRSATAVLWHWIEHLLPKHFGRSNWHRYGFKRRTAATQKKKARKYGHTAALANYPIGHPPATRPTLEAYLRELPDIRQIRHGAQAEWRTPGITLQYKLEATAVNAEDAGEMATMFHGALLEEMNSGRAPLKQSVRRRLSTAALVRMMRMEIA